MRPMALLRAGQVTASDTRIPIHSMIRPSHGRQPVTPLRVGRQRW
jgi:hypothetical protein